uniref:uncharacterized protein LOC129119220 n=1 Tax=Agelaius phoeniceus TaxID=39638 RepID=UPI0023EB0324|nr:uncharacterized protein LOC129119220 [Agelaius phoeniceus]XP_054487084.1 uncharacterized protein LOC129119220 [Agelaius phoeniceus]XP_054487085.1 uncharacterized protein LOC129119220 [Agelaius phoeniceus]XP_054487086.1 uncharacterized protein LOC129119220 [Agelaius phoeniceus]XP_054487088.1 uncharacterized protein LOC129119220 [Agelaius phoeniceus]XP_054487089.1 uncharacterized protein LOC129119220 [Agelaius phoeniceus]XP_054487090.1 uncharacterized protein LOC129119220 [Agelaius phoeniceu
MDLWPAKGYLSQEGGGTSRVNNTPAFSCSDRFRSRARSFYGSYFQSYHVRVLLWMPLCEEGRGEVPALSRRGCRKGRALRGCVQPMFNHLRARMCSNSPALIVSLQAGFVLLGLGKESHDPSSPFWGAPGRVSGVTCDPSEQAFVGRLCAPQNTSAAAWKCRFSHWEALGLQARPLWAAPTLGMAEQGLPFVVPPGFGASASPGALFAGKRPRALATPRIGCSVTTRKPGPGRSEAAADPGVPLPGCLHPWGTQPGTPVPPEPGAVSRSSPGVHCCAAPAASPWPRVYLVLIYFPPFVEKRCWLPRSPQALFLSVRAGKGKCHPVLCLKGIINSGQLCLSLPALPALQSRGFGSVAHGASRSLLILGSS